MDDRIRDRRRFVRRERGRRRVVPILLLALIVIAAGTFLGLRSSSVFAVRTVSATATQHVNQQDIATATAPSLGVNLLKLSTGSIEKALAALPYVREAKVYRDFPNTLEVQLVEYEPVARLQAGEGNVWLVSDDGRALEKITPPRGYTLPLVIPAENLSLAAGDKLPEEIVSALPIVRLLAKDTVVGNEDDGSVTKNSLADRLPDIKQVAVSAAGDLTLVLADGSELRLGAPTELERKLTVAADIIQQCLRDGKKVQYIDVSVPERAAVKAK